MRDGICVQRPGREKGQFHRLSLIIPLSSSSGGGKSPEVLTFLAQIPVLAPTQQARLTICWVKVPAVFLPAGGARSDPGLFLSKLSSFCLGEHLVKVTLPQCETSDEPGSVPGLLAPIPKCFFPYLQLQVDSKKPSLLRKCDRPSSHRSLVDKRLQFAGNLYGIFPAKATWS